MSVSPTLRELQAPLKARYESDPDSAKLTIAVRSTTGGNDPTKVKISTDAGGGVDYDVGAHPYAGGQGDLACSGDLLLAALAACQEITLRMVAAAMGITLDTVELSVEGEMDFRGTMGVDPETPVGFQRIRTIVKVSADVPTDRLDRLFQRAERYCVVNSTLRNSPVMETQFSAEAV
jgi:uncharacterized OsmC-like protein